MFVRQQLALVCFALSTTAVVDGFIVTINTSSSSRSLIGTRTTMRVYSTAAPPPEKPPKANKKKPPNKPDDKVTKEAQELIDAFGDAANAAYSKGNKKMVIAQVAPSVRVGIGEEFGLNPNQISPGQLVAGLKALGFDVVLDTNTAADLTIMEEGTELLGRLTEKLQQGKKATSGDNNMPLFTSCCPGWMQLVEKSNPELAPYISSCKSPHMMYGAVVKKYSERMIGLQAEDVYFCSIMPCVRKRGESDAAAFAKDGIRDIDNVVTTKDIGVLFRQKGINPAELEPVQWDTPFVAEAKREDGVGSGAGQLFGATGGVMEAAVRTVYQVFTGEQLPRLELDVIRGLDGVKETTLQLPKPDGSGDVPVKIAVVNGLGNAKKLIKALKAGECEYDFVEVMACPSGCINGGGQPKGDVQKRLDFVYELDRTLPIRQSHENPIIEKLYDEYLGGEYGSHEAHEFLHVEPVYGRVPTSIDSDLKP